MSQEDDSDRQSLLTSLQREYLKNGSDATNEGRQMRLRIWDRVEQGLADIAIFNQYARPDDIEKVFDKNNGDYEDYATEPNQDALDGEKEPIYDAHWVFARHMVALLWHGLRANKMDKSEIFEKVIVGGIEWGEADYQGVEHGAIESDVSLKKLEVHENRHDMDPVEKWERGLGLNPEDFDELTNRLSQHPEVDTIVGKDVGELIDEYLVESHD